VQVGLIALSPASEITMLARAAFGVVLLLCVGIPVVRGIRSSLRTGPESDDSLDLDELWALYRRGEISWDEYLRGKIEGARRLAGTKAQSSSNFTSDDTASS
jgi:hypothetical protein